jgi:hypothetical protein
MILNKVILIISSFFVATNAQCPTWWWPMSNANSSINFFSEVMRGNNILAMPGVSAATINTFSVPDRMAAGRNYKSITLTAIQYIVLPADSYFCNGAFTITLFVKQTVVAAGVIADFIDVAGTNIVKYEIASRATSKLTIGATTVISSTHTTITDGAWFFLAVSYGGSGSTPIFYATTVAPVASPVAVASGAAASTAPSCSIMTTAHIGASTANPPDSPLASSSLNDFKIYNFGLTLAQVQARYAAEVGKILKYMINSKIFSI